jgi:hypothetical protein
VRVRVWCGAVCYGGVSGGVCGVCSGVVVCV